MFVGVAAAVGVAAITQQISGFGFSLLAVPLMALLIGPKEAVAVAAMTGAPTSGLMAIRLRHRVERPVLVRMLVGAAFGLPLGVVGLRSLPDDPLRVALAAAVLSMVVVLASGYRFRSERPRTEVAAGFVSGVLNTSIGTAGPPVVITLQAAAMEQHVFRATTSAFFAGSNLVAVPLILTTGVASADTWLAGGVALPTVFVANALGERLAARVEPHRFRVLVLTLLVVAAVAALTSAFA